MKAIAERIWTEPAVALGALTTLALLAVALLAGADWGADTIVGVLAPLVSALGIRQLVTPTTRGGSDGDPTPPEPALHR